MDAQLVLTPDGGDLVMQGQDLKTIFGFQNMPLIGLFGGNVEASTSTQRNQNQQDYSWWGNALVTDPKQQINSQTERTLRTVPLTSAGRLQIIAAVNADLDFMRDFCTVNIEVTIISVDRVRIGIELLEPGNLQGQQFIFIWDATLAELVDVDYVAPGAPIFESDLKYNLPIIL